MRPQRADRATEDSDRFYMATYDRIFRALRSMPGAVAAAKDCTQDAFLNAFKAWRTWKPDASAEAWPHRIAINTAVSCKRRPVVLRHLHGYTNREVAVGLGVPQSTVAAGRRDGQANASGAA